MRRVNFLLAWFLLGLIIPFIIVGLCYGAPFLVCDPQPNHITHYIVNLDGTETEVPAQDLGDGTVRLHFDLAGVPEGSHHVEVRAKNIWGVSDPAPFDFTRENPQTPSGFSISAE